jgi:hypothetical protein
MFGAQNSPEETTSNLAGWATFLGLDQIPGWLAAAQIDAYATVLGAVLALASVAYVIVLYRRAGRVEVLAGDLALAFERKTATRRESKIPKLEVFLYGIEQATEKNRAASPAEYWDAIYVKVGVRTARHRIRGVRAYLTRVRRKTGQEIEDGPQIDPISLLWSLTNQQTTIDIEDGIDRCFDVLTTSVRDPHLRLCRGVLWPLKIRNFFDQPAEYLLDMAVTGEGVATQKITIAVDWRGDWKSVTAKKI